VSVVAFGSIFSLSGAVGGIFGQNYGAGLWARVRSTYRDALVFCGCYTIFAWAVLSLTANGIIAAFDLSAEGAEVYRTFGLIGSASFILLGGLFVSVSAFNTLGKPMRATFMTWLRDGVLMFPVALWMTSQLGATGAVYAQALVGSFVGVSAALWGWRFVAALGAEDRAADQEPA
jgi:Na+-driven multidrug efflux pump